MVITVVTDNSSDGIVAVTAESKLFIIVVHPTAHIAVRVAPQGSFAADAVTSVLSVVIMVTANYKKNNL